MSLKKRQFHQSQDIEICYRDVECGFTAPPYWCTLPPSNHLSGMEICTFLLFHHTHTSCMIIIDPFPANRGLLIHLVNKTMHVGRLLLENWNAKIYSFQVVCISAGSDFAPVGLLMWRWSDMEPERWSTLSRYLLISYQCVIINLLNACLGDGIQCPYSGLMFKTWKLVENWRIGYIWAWKL